MLSYRFSVKSMFMGVVGRPVPHRNFDGNIFLGRVSKKKYISKCTTQMGKRIEFCTDLHISVSELKNIF